MGYRVFSAGQYKIRQRGNKYYVYKLENDDKGNVRERYVGPLDKVVEFYVSSGGVGVSPTMDRPGFEPGTSRVRTEHSSRLSYRPSLINLMGKFKSSQCDFSHSAFLESLSVMFNGFPLLACSWLSPGYLINLTSIPLLLRAMKYCSACSMGHLKSSSP